MPTPLVLPWKEGDLAPDFSVTDNTGALVRLSALQGQFVVLYFYPKDNTPGCTREACAFRDRHPEFLQLNAVVLGVSADGSASHDRFIRKYQLPFRLLVDADKVVLKAYGVWGRKSFLGKVYDGVHRVTYLIAPDGRIRRVWAKVKPEVHPDEVLSEIRKN